MRDLSRMKLYSSLLYTDDADRFNNAIIFNMELLNGVEDSFLTDDFPEIEGNSYNSSIEDSSDDILGVLRRNITTIRENDYLSRDTSVMKSIDDLEKYIEKIVAKGGRISSKHLFNKLINELSAYNDIALTRDSISMNLTAYKKDMSRVFLSHAYVDRLYTYALFKYFYNKDVYLYVDWMHNDKIPDGKELKQKLKDAINHSSQLLFMRTLNSELDIQGKQTIRSWCAWELGNFYSSISENEKYFFNLYSTDNYENIQLHGLKLYTHVEKGKLQGIENTYREA